MEIPMTRCLAVLTILMMVFTGCSKKKQSVDKGVDKVTLVAADDPKMNAAIEKARYTVNTFIIALKSHRKNEGAFSVKMAFSDGTNTEHIWLDEVRYDGTKFTGIVANDPELVKSVKIRQKASVASGEISDWMYVENGKLIGGYTLRVLRDGMSPAERAEFDKSVPFTVD
jgi:uncharacterized protein YegJ (DUF2314 family)